MKKKMVRMNLSIDKRIRDKIDKIKDKTLATNRTEVIRHAIAFYARSMGIDDE